MSYLGPSLRRSARRASRPWRRVLPALLVSLLVNALVLFEINQRWSLVPSHGPATPERDVTLTPLTASEWNANRSIHGSRSSASDAVRLAPVAPAPPPQQRQVPGQVVDVAPSNDHTPPKDTRFVSEQNNTVKKETRSRDARAGFKSTLPKPTSPSGAVASRSAPAPSPAQRPAPVKGQGPREGAASAPQQAQAGSRAPERLALLPHGELRNPMIAVAPVPMQAGEGGKAGGDGRPLSPEGAEGSTVPPGPPGRLALRPSAAEYDRIAGGPAPDHLEGVEEGEGTYLNTREWKYSGYFNRIKQAVASVWDPGASMVARDPSGSRFSDRDWQTLVRVRLDTAGVLKDVMVEHGSGLDFLDHIALDAFRKAQPFSNPPAGLADEHGEIVFSFGFYVQTGASGMRLFRTPH